MKPQNYATSQILESLAPAPTKEPPKATTHEVVMKKSELIETLIGNKARHDAAFDSSILGYWSLAKEKLEEKEKALKGAIKDLEKEVKYRLKQTETRVDKKEALPDYINYAAFAWDGRLGLIYPENHSNDYERVIRMMQASVYDEVRLTEQEFDTYVLNNWAWKKNFVANNSAYVNKSISNKDFIGFMNTQLQGVSGPEGAQGPIGAASYAKSRASYVQDLSSNGLSNF